MSQKFQNKQFSLYLHYEWGDDTALNSEKLTRTQFHYLLQKDIILCESNYN